MGQSDDDASPSRELTGESPAGVDEQVDDVPERTASQVTKKIEVDHVARRVDARRTSVNQLQQKMTQLEHLSSSAEKLQSSREALAALEETHKVVRNCAEDLTEDML